MSIWCVVCLLAVINDVHIVSPKIRWTICDVPPVWRCTSRLARLEAHAEELEHKQAALVKAVQKGKELHLLKKQLEVHAAEKEALLAAAEARAAHAEEADAEAQREKEVRARAAGEHMAELESRLMERDVHEEELEARLQEASAYSALLGEREAQARAEAEEARARVTELEGQLEGLTGEMSLLTHAAERSHARQHTLQQNLQAAQADLAEARASSEVAAAVQGVAKVDLAEAEFGAELEAAKKATADNKEKLTKAVKKGKAIEREKRALEVKLDALMLEMAPPNLGEGAIPTMYSTCKTM
jgi:fused signal recognition particle receptor